MNKAQKAYRDFMDTDIQSLEDSTIHRMNPLLKLILAVSFILITVSFGKYDLSGLIPMIIFPVTAYRISGVSIRTCIRRMKYILPFILAVGIFNPFFDKNVLFTAGNIRVTGGFVSMVTLMIKGFYCILASYLLTAVTPVEDICISLRKTGFPKILTDLILMTYRYISMFLNEVGIMTESYSLRSPGSNGIKFSAWGSFLGQLILRSMDRSEKIYESMNLRGFSGDFHHEALWKTDAKSLAMTSVFILMMLTMRYLNVSGIIGRILMNG